jgi:cytidine deaminase
MATAVAAAENAYAPYSGFRVGAAVLTRSGNVFQGCNVENASYGLTNCAERVAIGAAVASEGPTLEIVALAASTIDATPAAPCGACRQVIAEFGPQCTVLFNGPEGCEIHDATDLLPGVFTLEQA